MYFLLKICVRLGLKLYCKKIDIKLREHKNTPVILACNHPNSFLDALIIGSHYKRPIHFLARGDVFFNPIISRLLGAINIIPVYRISEGREQLKYNQESFDECLEVLQNNGAILIFSEGICKNEWTVRPLKKGTARLAYTAFFEKGIDNLSIIPVSVSYSSFKAVPVTTFIKEGHSIRQKDVIVKEPAKFYQQFNALLQERLKVNLRSAADMEEADIKDGAVKRLVLSLPAFVGWLTHKGFYNLWREIARRKTEGTVFFHSVLFGLLLITYPVVLVLITTPIVLLSYNFYYLLLLVLLPFTAWCYKEYKR